MNKKKGSALRYSKEEKEHITRALKYLAVETARFWDTLREVEQAHAVLIEYDTALIDLLVGDFGTPPHFTDVADKDVWAMFREHTEIYK